MNNNNKKKVYSVFAHEWVMMEERKKELSDLMESFFFCSSHTQNKLALTSPFAAYYIKNNGCVYVPIRVLWSTLITGIMSILNEVHTKR